MGSHLDERGMSTRGWIRAVVLFLYHMILFASTESPNDPEGHYHDRVPRFHARGEGLSVMIYRMFLVVWEVFEYPMNISTRSTSRLLPVLLVFCPKVVVVDYCC